MPLRNRFRNLRECEKRSSCMELLSKLHDPSWVQSNHHCIRHGDLGH